MVKMKRVLRILKSVIPGAMLYLMTIYRGTIITQKFKRIEVGSQLLVLKS